MKIRPLGVDLFNADRRTEKHDKADSRFSQFCEPTSETVSLHGINRVLFLLEAGVFSTKYGLKC
jgi:hypothetical protein